MIILVPTLLELERLAPGAEVRDDAVAWSGREDADGRPVLLARCGLGVEAAAVRATILLARHGGPACLAGLAGTLQPDRLAVGSVLVASSVELHGIGAGEGERFVPIASVGGALAAEAQDLAPIALRAEAPGAVVGTLLTVAAASGDGDEASRRRRMHPQCLAEDMESHAVALAAQRLGVALTVIRGTSNVAGDRRQAGWRVDEALAGVGATVDAWIATTA